MKIKLKKTIIYMGFVLVLSMSQSVYSKNSQTGEQLRIAQDKAYTKLKKRYKELTFKNVPKRPDGTADTSSTAFKTLLKAYSEEYADLRMKYNKLKQNTIDTKTTKVQVKTEEKLTKLIFLALYDFDLIYTRWQNEKQISPQIWLNLAKDKFKKIETLAKGKDYDKETSSLLLRSKLLLAECYLFASVDYFLGGDKTSALRYQNEGIILLENLLNEYDPQNDYLPSWSNDLNTTYAGYEQVGTRLSVEHYMSSGGFENKRIIDFVTTGVRNSATYHSIAKHQKRVAGIIKNNRNLDNVMSDFSGEQRLVASSTGQQQESTSNAAKRLLSEFCPWGVEFYQLLRKSELAKGLDLKILKPYGGLDWTLVNLIDELGLESIVPYGGEIFKNNTVYPPNPPNMSQFNISKEKIPMHISDEMKLIQGNSKYGFLDIYRKEKVQWDWVGHKATYTITFFSPRLVDMRLPSENLKVAFDLYDFFSGGVLAYMTGKIVDDTITQLLAEVKKYYGSQNKVYLTSSFLVNNKGHVNTTSNILIKDKLPDPLSLLQKMASSVFGALDSTILNGMYEGLDPRKFSLGKSYDGSSIPSIMIRANTLGFQKIPIDEYSRTLEIIRFYSPLPSYLASKTFKKYNLQEKENRKLTRSTKYLEEQTNFESDTMNGATLAVKGRNVGDMEDVRKWVWKERTGPFLRTIRINDMSPWAQTLTIELPEKKVKQWQKQLDKNKTLHVQLHAKSKTNRYKIPIINDSFNKSKLTLIIYNTHHPKGKSLGSEGLMEMARLHGKKENISYGVSDARGKNIGSDILNLLDYRMPTQYIVKITSGKNGKILKEFPLVLKKERGNSKVKITGDLSSRDDSSVVLDYKAKEEKIFDCAPPRKLADNNKNVCICPAPWIMNKEGNCITCDELDPNAIPSEESKMSWARPDINNRYSICLSSQSSDCKYWNRTSLQTCICSDKTRWNKNLKKCAPICLGPASFDYRSGSIYEDANGCWHQKQKNESNTQSISIPSNLNIDVNKVTPGFNWSQPVNSN